MRFETHCHTEAAQTSLPFRRRLDATTSAPKGAFWLMGTIVGLELVAGPTVLVASLLLNLGAKHAAVVALLLCSAFGLTGAIAILLTLRHNRTPGSSPHAELLLDPRSIGSRDHGPNARKIHC